MISASTEEPVGSVPEGTNADIDAAVKAARAAFDDPSGWSSWSVEDRAQALERFAGALESRGEEAARRVSLQNGMPISFALMVEAVFPAVLARYYAGLIRQMPLQEDRQGLLGGTVHVVSKPVGVVGAIVPWNYPQTLALFKLAPLLAAGCTVVMKPSPETVLDSLLLAEAIDRGRAAARRRQHRARPVARSGPTWWSTPASTRSPSPAPPPPGRQIAAALRRTAAPGHPGARRQVGRDRPRRRRPLRRPTEALFGGDAGEQRPDVQHRHADARTARALRRGRRGVQRPRRCACRSATRSTPRRRSARSRARASATASRATSRRAAPRARASSPAAVARRTATAAGSSSRRSSPTCRTADTIAREEIFGPVLAVIPYDGVDEAVAIANDSEYGLGGSVWTQRSRARRSRGQARADGQHRHQPLHARPGRRRSAA